MEAFRVSPWAAHLTSFRQSSGNQCWVKPRQWWRLYRHLSSDDINWSLYTTSFTHHICSKDSITSAGMPMLDVIRFGLFYRRASDWPNRMMLPPGVLIK
jgi:hypothetical protein